MKAFVKCELCDKEISSEKCELAGYKTIIDGEEHFFCCKRHAEEFQQKR